VQYAAQAALSRGEQRHYIPVRLAVVDDDRLFCRDREVELIGKRFPLRLARGEVIMIIQPDFADGYDLLLLQRALHAQKVGAIRLAGGVRMDARAAIDKVVKQRKRLYLRDIFRFDAGFNKAAHARRRQGGDQRVSVLVKFIVE